MLATYIQKGRIGHWPFRRWVLVRRLERVIYRLELCTDLHHHIIFFPPSITMDIDFIGPSFLCNLFFLLVLKLATNPKLTKKTHFYHYKSMGKNIK